MERRAVRPSDHGTLRHCSYEDLLGSAVPPQQRRHFLSQLSASSLVVRKLGARGGEGAVFILLRMSAHRTSSRQAMEYGRGAALL